MPEIRWMINTGNKRREDTQALMIPDLAAKGFKVVADNSDADTVFQKRLPGLDYDLAMYISTATPGPDGRRQSMLVRPDPVAREQQPGPEPDRLVQRGGLRARWRQSDAEVDETARIDLIHQIGQCLVDDHVLLPLYQFPNIAAWRTDKVDWSGRRVRPGNFQSAFNNLNKWEPVGGTEILIGAEQWPDCINPVTECANSSWMVWTAPVPLVPGVWDTTADGYAPTALVTEEPTVELA